MGSEGAIEEEGKSPTLGMIEDGEDLRLNGIGSGVSENK